MFIQSRVAGNEATVTSARCRKASRGWFAEHLASLKKRSAAVNGYSKKARDEQREQKSGQRASDGWCIGVVYPLLRDYAPVIWHFTSRRDTLIPLCFKSQSTCNLHTVDSPGLNAKGSRGVSIRF